MDEGSKRQPVPHPKRCRATNDFPVPQVLFVRLSQDGELHPPRTTTSGMESISDAAATAYRELHTFAAHCLRAVGSGSDVSPEHLTALLDYTSGQPREGLSASFMSLFEYRPGPPPSGGQGIASDRPASSVGFPCAEHVDYSLLTLIPFTEPGLEVLDLKRFEWVCPEESNTTPSGDDSGGRRLAVLMVGESLEMLSSGLLSATTHRVVSAKPTHECP